jgi:hypothetical protein
MGNVQKHIDVPSSQTFRKILNTVTVTYAYSEVNHKIHLKLRIVTYVRYYGRVICFNKMYFPHRIILVI